MKVLLSDGSGLTARQSATRLAAAGHTVEALAPDPWCICRFTRTVQRVHRVPAYGNDPVGWLDVALDIYRRGRFDVLFPTQEQVAVLSWAGARLDDAGVSTVIPPFSALSAVQDKISASATLDRLGIPQPVSSIDPSGWERFPAFVKDPIGTASGGVRIVKDSDELSAATRGERVLVQAATSGPLVMCQSVFDRGSLLAFHACRRTAEGAGGGASRKLSVSLPDVMRWMERLGSTLGWHGALSADVILGPEGPVFIDVNPRLVEPANAYLSGVDLVGAMMELATGGHPDRQPEGQPGVATHQLLLAILGAAAHGKGRRGVAMEIVRAVGRSDGFRSSREELTPVRHDLISVLPVLIAATATVAAPASWKWFASGSVANYALSAEGWDRLQAVPPEVGA